MPAAVSDNHDLPKKQAEAVLRDLVMLTTKHLKKGGKIRLTGLGVLQVRKRAARMGRNPATGGIHQDQGEQEDRIQAGEGTEGSSVASQRSVLLVEPTNSVMVTG